MTELTEEEIRECRIWAEREAGIYYPVFVEYEVRRGLTRNEFLEYYGVRPKVYFSVEEAMNAIPDNVKDALAEEEAKPPKMEIRVEWRVSPEFKGTKYDLEHVEQTRREEDAWNEFSERYPELARHTAGSGSYSNRPHPSNPYPRNHRKYNKRGRRYY